MTRQFPLAARQQAEGARGVLESVESMTMMTQRVADATVEQKRGGDQVVKAIEQIGSVAQQNLVSTHQLRETTEGRLGQANGLEDLSTAFTV